MYLKKKTAQTYIVDVYAREAGVPFFSISASEFVEIFAGIGASRVRDLFEQAKKNAPRGGRIDVCFPRWS